MIIAHLADLHIGSKLQEIERNKEIENTLDEVVSNLKEKGVQIVLICGDIFEYSRPSSDSFHLFYSFLKKLKLIGVSKIFIIAGNHDHQSLLEIAKEFLQDSGIHIWGRLSNKIEDYCYSGKLEEEFYHIFALPYLSEYKILSEIGKSEEALKMSYTKRYNHYYKTILELMKERAEKLEGTKIFMGHLFVENASFSQSEKESTLEKWLCVPREYFENKNPFNYIALGHIHREQKIKNSLYSIYYSGSLIRLSFKERNERKGFRIFDSSTEQSYFVELKTPKIMEEYDLKIDELYDLEHIKAPPVDDKIIKYRIQADSSLFPFEIRQKMKDLYEDKEYKLEISFKKENSEEVLDQIIVEKSQDFMQFYEKYKGSELKDEVYEELQKLVKEVLEEN